MQRGRLLVAAAAVALLTVVVAWPSLDYGFVYDDEAVVLERTPFWELGVAGFLGSRPFGTGRHLTAVSLDLDRLGAGTAVAGPFHRSSVLLAALLSALALLLARRIGLGLAGATAAAALFAVHPVHVDAVVWITGRSELLAALGVLAALLACIPPPGAEARPWRAGLLTALFATLAVHSKESALCLPLLLVAARLTLGPRVAWLPGLAGSAAALLTLAIVVVPLVPTFGQPTFIDNPLIYAPFFERIPKAMAILWSYAGLLVWPSPLLLDRSWAQVDPGLQAGWLATALWLLAAAAVWRMRERHPAAAFAAAWFPLAFAVTANVAGPIGTLMAERLLLLPSLSACLLAGLLVDRVATTPARLALAASGVLVAVFALSGAFRHRAAPFESGETYFAALAAWSPHSAKAHHDQALWLQRQKRPLEAEAAFARALEIAPFFAKAANQRAESMGRRGDPSAGADVYLDYLEHRPKDVTAVINLTRLLLDAGRTVEAVTWARRWVQLSPDDREAVDALILAEEAHSRAGAGRPGAAVSP